MNGIFDVEYGVIEQGPDLRNRHVVTPSQTQEARLMKPKSGPPSKSGPPAYSQIGVMVPKKTQITKHLINITGISLIGVLLYKIFKK